MVDPKKQAVSFILSNKRRYDCVYLTLVIYDCRLENPACVDGFPVDIDDLLASLLPACDVQVHRLHQA